MKRKSKKRRRRSSRKRRGRKIEERQAARGLVAAKCSSASPCCHTLPGARR